MNNIEQKRVYSKTAGETDVFVVTEAGIARVACSGGLIGGFGLVQKCTGIDIAASGGQLAVATTDEVLVRSRDNFVSIGGFGCRPVAVGYHDGLVVAGSDRIARHTGDGWVDLEVNADKSLAVTAICDGLVGTDRGVYRMRDGVVSSVGLVNVRDVCVTPVPLAGTRSGVYQLKNGWELVFEGDVHCVESDGTRVHVGTDDGLYVRTAGEFERIPLPVTERITGIGYGESTYAVTVAGTFLIDSGDKWRARSIGLSGVCGLAVPERKRV